MARRRQHDSEGTVASSMTDLMTSLAVVFILLLVAYLNQSYMENKRRADRYKQLMAHSKNVKSELTGTLTVQLQKLGGEDTVVTPDPTDPLAVIIPISDEKLGFGQGQCAVNEDGKKELRKIVPGIADVICSPGFCEEVESILIEGHTNTDGTEESNLKLSQDRSLNVLKCVLNECGLKSDQRDTFLDLVSANGRGQRHLKYNADGTEDKKASRRVVFKIRVKSVEQKRVVLG